MGAYLSFIVAGFSNVFDSGLFMLVRVLFVHELDSANMAQESFVPPPSARQSGVPPIDCFLCDFKASSRTELIAHEKACHTQSFLCECGKRLEVAVPLEATQQRRDTAYPPPSGSVEKRIGWW